MTELTPSEKVLRLALLQLVKDRISREIDQIRADVGPLIIAARQGIAAVTPDGARVAELAPRFRPAEQRAQVHDRREFVDWVKSTRPDTVQVREEVAEWFEQELLARLSQLGDEVFDPKTGEVVPGVEFVQRPAESTVSLRFTPASKTRPSGKDLLLDALQSGELAVDFPAHPEVEA